MGERGTVVRRADRRGGLHAVKPSREAGPRRRRSREPYIQATGGVTDQMDWTVFFAACPLDGLQQYLSARHNGSRRRGRHEDEVTLDTRLGKSLTQCLFDVHEVVESTQRREAEDPGNQGDVMP